MCEYCKEPIYDRKSIYKDACSDITLDSDNDFDISYEESFGFESMYYHKTFKINYCPMCGRELK